MMGISAEIDALTVSERNALRALLIRATAAAGRPSDADELARLVALAPIDSLPAAAVLHRVAGAVLNGLRGVDGVPDAVAERLGAVRDQAIRRHLLFTAALGEIGAAFEAAGIVWVAMKGPVIVVHYPDVGGRTYNDLDLLVDRRDFPRAVSLLEDLAYRHSIHDWALAEHMLAGELTMWRESVPVDLHWHLHYSQLDRRPIAIVPEAMIQRRRSVTLSGLRTSTLDVVDTVLTLAFHAARSDGHRLVWLKDIERQVAAEPPDFDELIRRCRVSRCAPSVGLMLDRARTALDADIPHDVVRALVPWSLRAAHRVVCAVSSPVQLHERPTLTRALTRSVRSSLTTSLSAVPARAARRVLRVVAPPRANETDDPDEKDSYFRAVVASIQR